MNQSARIGQGSHYVDPAAIPDRREPSLANHSCTVLLIEDDRDVSKSIARLLRSHHYQVLTAAAGSESLKVMAENSDIDVVLMDIVLPDMTGVQVASLIRAKHPHTPIIFSTGVGNVAELKGIEEKRLLRKPFTEREFFEKISTALYGG